MTPLDVTQNPDGTWTFNGELADPVSVSTELWAQLEASEHVVVERRPAGDQGQPAVTYVAITTLSIWLNFTVIRELADRVELTLSGYAENSP